MFVAAYRAEAASPRPSVGKLGQKEADSEESAQGKTDDVVTPSYNLLGGDYKL